MAQHKEIKELEKKQKDYPAGLSKLTTQELAYKIHDLYLETAFLRKTRYATSLFEEYFTSDQAERKAVTNIDVGGYGFQLNFFLSVEEDKEQLNQILQKYNFGAVYSFILPITQIPLDMPFEPKKSHLRVVDMGSKYRYFIHKDNHDEVSATLTKNIESLAVEDKEEVGILIARLVNRINLIEQEFLRH